VTDLRLDGVGDLGDLLLGDRLFGDRLADLRVRALGGDLAQPRGCNLRYQEAGRVAADVDTGVCQVETLPRTSASLVAE
jgi:hypothetical protein